MTKSVSSARLEQTLQQRPAAGEALWQRVLPGEAGPGAVVG